MDVASLGQLVEGCDVVFHLAALASMWSADDTDFYRVNVTGTRNVVREAKAAGVRKFIFTSTAGRFGPSGIQPVSESTERQFPLMNPYERTKLLAEQVVLDAIDDTFEVVIVNPSRVYGPGRLSESNGVTRMVKLYLEGAFRVIPGNGEYRGSYVYVDDVVDGHLNAVAFGRSGEVYLLGGENCSLNDLFDQLKGISRCSRLLFHVPYLLIRVAAFFFDLLAKYSGKPPFITQSWLKRFMMNWEVSSDKAIQQLHYRITPLHIGLRKTIDALREPYFTT